MALITCKGCGSEISDKANKCPKCGRLKTFYINCYECNKEFQANEKFCPNCGAPKMQYGIVKSKKKASKWIRLRNAFGYTNLILGSIILFGILISPGGFEKNLRPAGMAWILISCGILGVFMKKSFRATIVLIVLHSIGVLYNLAYISEAPGHALIAILTMIFLVFTSISLSFKDSFE